jgi:hypothetical protein
VLLTGLRLMRAAELVADLRELHPGHGLPYVDDLIALKRGAEHGPFPQQVRASLAEDVPRLRAELAAARDASPLPDRPCPDAVAALQELLVRVRLGR